MLYEVITPDPVEQFPAEEDRLVPREGPEEPGADIDHPAGDPEEGSLREGSVAGNPEPDPEPAPSDLLPRQRPADRSDRAGRKEGIGVKEEERIPSYNFV